MDEKVTLENIEEASLETLRSELTSREVEYDEDTSVEDLRSKLRAKLEEEKQGE